MNSINAARSLADKVTSAHGGVEKWRSSSSVRVRFRAWGPAFTSRGQAKALDDVVGVFGTRDQRVSLQGSNWSFRSDSSAQLVSATQRLRRAKFRWSSHDVGTFAAMAMWTYLNLPFVLLDPDVLLDVRPPHDGSLERLYVQLPGRIATHCHKQVLHVDDAGLIRRHDYTAEAISRLAVASQRLCSYQTFDGLVVATRRRVTPRLGDRVLPVPSLVRIEISELDQF